MLKIHGDSNSGNCLKVKFVCDRLAIPYDWVEVDTRNRQTRTTEFLKLNNAGQVPTVEFDDGRTLAESNAIIKYLARGSDLIPGDAFAAGFLTGRLQGWPLEYSLRFASAVGASCTRALGCIAGVFSYHEAVAFVDREPLEILQIR